MSFVISIAEARKLHLLSTGLTANTFAKGKAGTLQAIEHLGYVQIDTISVVERAHHHVLYSRLPFYKPQHLYDLVEKDKTVFEYWSHAAAYLPMRDYRFSLLRKNLYNKGHWSHYKNKKVLKYVLERITAEGPLQSRHFEEDKKPTGWWNWKETKRALEQLFMQGTLMVAGRSGFQKVYDLTERVLPAHVNTTPPSADEFAQYLILSAIRANGFANEEEISYLRRGIKPSVVKNVEHLVKEGLIVPLHIKGVSKPYYTTDDALQLLNSKAAKKQVHILSPFDNSLIQRKRINTLFGFDYTIECYVPEPKRQYGYFCLPILYADKFVGRIDCKADRPKQQLLIKSLHFEEGFKRSSSFDNAFNTALKKFATFNGCKI
ncbi:MAG: crosslink repair DNA glycosylase YcaQ family protein [Chitinophagales bacterium]